MDYKNMLDSELAQIMVNYISRVRNLMDIIARYIEHPNDRPIAADRIKAEYSRLKNELRDDADYLNLMRNFNGSQLYMYIFSPSIKEAAAHGFTLPTNHKIDQQMHSAVEEAHYRLNKYYMLEQWGELM